MLLFYASKCRIANIIMLKYLKMAKFLYLFNKMELLVKIKLRHKRSNVVFGILSIYKDFFGAAFNACLFSNVFKQFKQHLQL